MSVFAEAHRRTEKERKERRWKGKRKNEREKIDLGSRGLIHWELKLQGWSHYILHYTTSGNMI